MKAHMKKYLKPKSLTFWAGAVPLLSGLLMAGSKVIPQLQPVSIVLDAIYGGTSPSALINAGIAAIGIRAAVA